jgi:hypothetical protein
MNNEFHCVKQALAMGHKLFMLLGDATIPLKKFAQKAIHQKKHAHTQDSARVTKFLTLDFRNYHLPKTESKADPIHFTLFQDMRKRCHELLQDILSGGSKILTASDHFASFAEIPA